MTRPRPSRPTRYVPSVRRCLEERHAMDDRLKRRETLALGSGLALSGLAAPAAAASGARVLASPEQLRPTYDTVIVGAGSAGSGLAYRPGPGGRGGPGGQGRGPAQPPPRRPPPPSA